MEVFDRVHQIVLGGEGPSGRGPTVSTYYVHSQDCGAFIDAGFPDLERTRPLLDYWRNSLGGPRTHWALVTHRHYEHAGGARLVKEATGAQVAAGAGDADAIEAEFGGDAGMVDLPLRGGEGFNLAGRRVRAIASPGHTAGTVCYFLEDEGILFTGDHIMGRGTVVVRTDEGGSMSQHIDSLRALLDLDLKVILSGHGPAILEPKARISELVRHRLEREEQVLALLRQGTSDVDALVARIYGETDQRRGWLARHQVVAHLKKLEEEKRAVAVGQGTAYRPV